ncbi:MAG TPA: CDP-alcohol phosphatidyltransferase family protein [Steroidobacteraceae bacterium]|jgi:phosphatidylglycerophosphate synthase
MSSESQQLSFAAPVAELASSRPWDARLARRIITPLKNSWVTPNHLTTLRLVVGLAAAFAFTHGTYGWSNLAALLLMLSNFLDHTDGELARISSKGSRVGHIYDLSSDAVVTILLFMAIGIGVSATLTAPPVLFGTVAGVAIALIFLLRMRIESTLGKSGTQQARFGGFEIEDVLYFLPLVTLCNGLPRFLLASAIGAPLFAIWVVIDYRRAMRGLLAAATAPVGAVQGGAATSLEAVMAQRLGTLDAASLRPVYTAQGAFLYIAEFLPPAVTAQLVAAVDSVHGSVNRNYLPGHKQGGSVSRHTLDRLAPSVASLYRSPALLRWLEQVAGEPLQFSPPDDPHAYALYFYSRPGDHIGWHYDTSYYAGRRYTLLLGVIDRSSCRLEYELHTRDEGVAIEAGAVRIAPGGLVFFDGDRLRHRITPLGDDELRVSLTFEYVTDPKMHPWWRLISRMKDAVAYFGFRQVFSRE